MDRYCAGDPAAFDALFERYHARLVRVLASMVGTAQAPDMVQITFMKVHQNRHRYRAGANVAAWLFTIARNTARDHLRSAPRRREVFKDEPIDGPAESRHRDMLQDERVREALLLLSKEQQEVIRLHWFGGLTFEEVSKIVDATPAAVRVRAHRGYKKLRTALQGLYKEARS